MVSHPENGSDSPIGSDRDRGRDINYLNPSLFLFLFDVGHTFSFTYGFCGFQSPNNPPHE